MHLNSLRQQILEARDARAATIARLAASLSASRSLVFLSLNIPGPEKNLPLTARVLARAREELLHAARDARVTEEGRDTLGPWTAVVCGEPALVAKRRCVAMEEATPAGRLLDLDVFAPDEEAARQVSRSALDLPVRRCLACDEPAVDCIRAGRHTGEELRRAVEALLQRDYCDCLADALVRAARVELALTPKPGLVDRRDNGSHPDLSFELMSRSIDLLPQYYGELLEIARRLGLGPDPAGLDACVEAGRRAEERMMAAIRGNAHRGYIFLSGLVLLAAARGATDAAAMRAGIREMASRILLQNGGTKGNTSHGAEVRRSLGVGGIHAEALAGLPSVFDHGLPALEHALGSLDSTDAAHHFLMATLMTRVEDTTALHRCGPQGLERLRADGGRLLAMIRRGEEYLHVLATLNDEYRATKLTMGGVADCMALTIALGERLK